MLLKNIILLVGGVFAASAYGQDSKSESIALGNGLAPSMQPSKPHKRLHTREFFPVVNFGASGPPSTRWAPVNKPTGSQLQTREFFPAVDYGASGPPPKHWDPASRRAASAPITPPSPPSPPSPPAPPAPLVSEPPVVLSEFDIEPLGGPAYTYRQWETPKMTPEEEADRETWKDGPPHTPGEFEFSLAFAWQAFKDLLSLLPIKSALSP
ncbi:uncharacterized protein LAJ45_04197 [Morchella importuna]|uniref:uncharacterized protein n=1 Tax=Morchella importuna TaxID=1174673 RepID=UPI001E8D7685|nr:uncharacterized protein LAJ45_04197 [Morchella importuna]KAH8151576.1 hypothetical protein LAJ45_04197 [Morchella importuna]